MTKEDKELLLKDLCARLPYSVLVKWKEIDVILTPVMLKPYVNEGCKPYLRPMSSMTKEEKEEMKEVIEIELTALEGPEGFSVATAASSAFEIDFYNKHHLDYRGLIPMGLALEAKEEMYKTE